MARAATDTRHHVPDDFHLGGINIPIGGFPYGNAAGSGDVESQELLATKRIEVIAVRWRLIKLA